MPTDREAESLHPDHREHAKMPPRPDDDQLAALTERERTEVATDQEGHQED